MGLAFSWVNFKHLSNIHCLGLQLQNTYLAD